MEKQTNHNHGCIHIYCGNGKGKTTCAVGLCVRAAGFGHKVLMYQFMKNNSSSERNILKDVANITIINGLEQESFSFQMTPEQKAEHQHYYESQFNMLTQKAADEQFDVVFFDEIVYAIGVGLFNESLLLEFLKNKPAKLEVILTGQNPSESLISMADYVSEICKRKHPFDKGLPSRKGIEK